LRNHRKICPLKGSVLSKKNGPFNCPTCGRVFKTSVGMKVHKHWHEEPPATDQPLKLDKKKKDPFICHLCGKLSALKTGLEQHLKFHFKIKDFACDKCSKSYYTKS
jgi:transcription elongation factor Elf1